MHSTVGPAEGCKEGSGIVDIALTINVADDKFEPGHFHERRRYRIFIVSFRKTRRIKTHPRRSSQLRFRLKPHAQGPFLKMLLICLSHCTYA